MYIFTIMDNYSATYPVLVIALLECLVLAWIYGMYRKTTGSVVASSCSLSTSNF